MAPIRMYSRWLGGAAVLMLALNAGAQDRGDRFEQARQTGGANLTVLWVESPGWAERDTDGRPTGVTIELMRRFGQWLSAEQSLQVDLKFQQVSDWTRFYQRVRDGDGGLFGLGNVTITEARRVELLFSPPYARNTGVLISSADVAEIRRPESLRETLSGQRAMAFAGTLHEQRLRQLAEDYWPSMRMDFTGSNDEILESVAAGTHFAYIDVYQYLRASAKGLSLRRHGAFDDSDETFGVIMPLNTDWQNLLAEFFESVEGGLSEAAWYRTLLEHHLGAAIARDMQP